MRKPYKKLDGKKRLKNVHHFETEEEREEWKKLCREVIPRIILFVLVYGLFLYFAFPRPTEY